MHEYNVFDILVDHFHPYCLMTVIAVWLALACRNGDRKIKIIGRQMAPRDSRSGWKGRMSMSDHTGQRAIESEGTETGGTPGTPTAQAGPSAAGRYGRRALMLGAAAAGVGVAAGVAGGGLAEAAPDASAVQLGKANSTSGTTSISSSSGTGVQGRTRRHGMAGVAGFDDTTAVSSPPTNGVYGHSAFGNGVLGISEHHNGHDG